MARIALVNAPFHSHIGAMMRLAGVLTRQGHELTVWAPEAWRAPVERLGARLEPSAPEIPRGPRSELAAGFALATEREAERLIPQLHDRDVDLLIRDSQTPWALVAAQYLGIPRIVAHPMFPMVGADSGEDPSEPSGGEQLEQLDPAERERFERAWLSIARRWGVELADVRGLHHDTSEPTLVFTTEEIVGEHELPAGWRCVGPLLSPPPRPDPDRERPLVYAAFGTAQNRRTDLFRVVIAALARRPVRLVVSTGGRSLSSEELGPLPPNVVVRDFAPAREMLAGAGVHITHAGSNSVHESLVAAVPMVCLPQAFDQIPLSRRIVQLGVGVIAAESPDAVERAVSTLLGDGDVSSRVGALAERLRRYDGERRVAAAIAECL